MSVKVQIILVLLLISGLVVQGIEVYRFINAGPRFTALDGQELCLRVSAIDGLPCRYGEAK